MIDHVANRKVILEELRRELVGQDPAGRAIDAAGPVTFRSWDEYRGPYHQEADGEEILIDQTPTQRYGVGVLFPLEDLQDPASTFLESTSALVEGEQANAEDINSSAAVQVELAGGGARSGDDTSADLDLSPANAFNPSSMAVSFLADLREGTAFKVVATGGRYIAKDVHIREEGKREGVRTIWLRKQVSLSTEIPINLLLGGGTKHLAISPTKKLHGCAFYETNLEGLDIFLEVFSRPTLASRQRLITVCLVNRSRGGNRSKKNSTSLFQSHLTVSVIGPDGDGAILPYPASEHIGDDEQVGLDMLYRDIPVFATGHGCAADWPSTTKQAQRSGWVSGECLPTVSLPPITPTILDEDGEPITISMASLCDLAPGTEAWRNLENLISQYEFWIETKEHEAASSSFPQHYVGAARENLQHCWEASSRMRAGLEYLASETAALTAFRFANEAMIRQQAASRLSPRPTKFDADTQRIRVLGDFLAADVRPVDLSEAVWRPFQIAFLLSSVESTGCLQSKDHELVDLIWFPTGGGKTEAYLGLAAYSMFLRRLRDPDDVGANVLMRYTLRLLTTQQFERASSLICAMERIRSANLEALGSEEFSIGIWLGRETTPNRREDALVQLGQYRRDRYADNPFLINRCPWCGAVLGRIELPGKGNRKPQGHAVGYKEETSADGTASVTIHCPDEACPFNGRLPILVIDEDIYASPPSLVIGTIDKFARLTWDDRPRRLFGIDNDGHRSASPPQLIIQDELHLISGPLGSLSGLLEPIIEDLCTDHRPARPIRPKIVCSTATTRRYRDQILGLYGRERVCLFPPPGLDASDSYFARTDHKAPGKIYVGVHAAGFGSYQTEWVRALTALVNAPMKLASSEERDPWWTLLMFCNSLRDMGTAHTLLNTDVLDYSVSLWQRQGTTQGHKRYISNATSVLELTGGLRRTQIKDALDALQTVHGSRGRTVDVCLATNIIEVGVDIPRLSLMAVAGQPKTTAQYIQATGRVGRDQEKPGLVVTLYGPSKPRDRSHFERFRSYHERLYAQVEPTSVTPFSPPALERFLHSSLIAHVRQSGAVESIQSPYPVPRETLQRGVEILRNRVRKVDESELSHFDEMFERRLKEWEDWERKYWDKAPDGEVSLLRRAGSYASAESRAISWSTMDSLRNVDAECHGSITYRYLNHPASSGTEIDSD